MCRCGHDHSSQPGWVTVLENKIAFSFDITRVMFCSGNNTERMRMGKYVLQEKEVIMIFIQGLDIILYYHPKMISHLYACEWNPDSVFSLQHNSITANVPDTQYTIIPGDNRITSVAKSLINLADRNLLGLLPSSTQGWPLAVRALKVTGGIIHVHENIFEKELSEWLEQMKVSFVRLFQEIKQQVMVLEILHVEKVKSYAPRVNHYVIDLKCSQQKFFVIPSSFIVVISTCIYILY